MEEMSLIRKNGASPAAFLEKLYDIMENKSLQPYISWQPDGLSFLIKDVQAVSEFVLPYYFKHNNIQSFVRQLNMYNFTKTRHDSNYREFRQPLFQRGRRDLLSVIKRKSQVSTEKSAAMKRKYNSNEAENEGRYSLAISNNEVSTGATKFTWDGDDEGVDEEVTTSSNCSSDNDVGDGQSERMKELDDIKKCMNSIESQIWLLSERYNVLSASYMNLHEKFDSFQSVYPSNQNFSAEKAGAYPVEALKALYRSERPVDVPPSIVRIISMDQTSKVSMDQGQALRSCSHLTDQYIAHPAKPATDKSDTCTSDQHQYLSKLLGTIDSGTQAVTRRRFEPKERVEGMGLDAMAAAATLRCEQPGLRSSLADLLDAAACRWSIASIRSILR